MKIKDILNHELKNPEFAEFYYAEKEKSKTKVKDVVPTKKSDRA